LHSWLIAWLQQMRASHPGLALELTVETTPVLVDQVQRGALDLVFAALPAVGEGLRSRALPSMEMVFVGHREQQRKRRYTLAELAALPDIELLTFQRGSQPWVGLQELLREAQVEARVHAISSISAMVQLVEAGFGVATLPRAAVQHLTQRPLKVLTVEPLLQRLPVHATHRVDPGSNLASGIVDAVLESVGATQVSARTILKQHRKSR
jgi:DNA-binding transcriptional LysR family regulator